MRPIRQGDVILLPTSNVRGDELPHLTLVEGISTGHSHRISKGVASLFSHQEHLYLKVRSKFAILSHDEHRSLKIPYGTWKVYVQREYVPQKDNQLSLQPQQEFVTDDNYDQEFLDNLLEDMEASSGQQLMADVIKYKDKKYSSQAVPAKSSPQKATDTNLKKASKRRGLSNWKYVVD